MWQKKLCHSACIFEELKHQYTVPLAIAYLSPENTPLTAENQQHYTGWKTLKFSQEGKSGLALLLGSSVSR